MLNYFIAILIAVVSCSLGYFIAMLRLEKRNTMIMQDHFRVVKTIVDRYEAEMAILREFLIEWRKG